MIILRVYRVVNLGWSRNLLFHPNPMHTYRGLSMENCSLIRVSAENRSYSVLQRLKFIDNVENQTPSASFVFQRTNGSFQKKSDNDIGSENFTNFKALET